MRQLVLMNKCKFSETISARQLNPLVGLKWCVHSVEVANDLATNLLIESLGVGHDALVGGDHDEAELTGGEDGVDEVLEVSDLEIETGRDDTALVHAAVELNNDLAGATVVNNGELVDVALSLHETEELNKGLGDRAEDHLKAKKLVTRLLQRSTQLVSTKPARQTQSIKGP
jgi:hypothetical protein